MKIKNKNKTWDVVILSPHMDDAVLSLGQHIIKWVKENKRVKIVTVMTSFGENENVPIYTKNYVIKSGFKSITDFQAARKKEDIEVMKSLGVEYEHWDLVDGGFRGEKKDLYYYPTKNDLVSGIITKKDRKIVRKITRMILKLKAKMILIPYGIGGHVDHVILKKAAEKVKKNSKLFYLESPYLWDNFNFLYIIKNIFKIKSLLIKTSDKNKLLKKYISQYLLWGNSKKNYIEVII